MSGEMRRKTGSLKIMAATILPVLAAAFFFSATVKSMTEPDIAEAEGYYREREEILVREVRSFLDASGYKNSGVMLTRIVDADGSRSYTLSVHHADLEKAQDGESAVLLSGISELEFSGEGILFRVLLNGAEADIRE